MLRWIINRGKEPSTWAGLTAIVIAAGLTDVKWTAISGILVAVFAALAVFLPERK